MHRFDAALCHAIKAYVGRATHVLEIVAKQPDPDALLAKKLAEDTFSTAMHMAVAIGYAARALCPPAGVQLPPFPDTQHLADLQTYAADVARHIADITHENLTQDVSHRAGEAELHHDPATYIARYAYPNMIFHLSMAYAGLRHAGVTIGKADFDGLHIYGKTQAD